MAHGIVVDVRLRREFRPKSLGVVELDEVF